MLALACRPNLGPARAVPLDPLFIDAAAAAPSQDFATDASVIVGDGWGPPEGDGRDPDWGSMAWTTARTATLLVPTLPHREMDFVARVLPFPWGKGSAKQTMDIVAGGRAVARVNLALEWQDVRVPLPASVATGRLETLRLEFAHAIRPRDVDQGPDERALAAAFAYVGVVPRSAHDAPAFLKAASFDRASGRAMVPSGGALSIALPASSRVRVQMQGAPSACAEATLATEVVDAAGVVHASREGRASVPLDETFETPCCGGSRLLTRVITPQSAGECRIELLLGKDAIVARTRPRSHKSPDVFVYVIDTLRADALAAYGGDATVAPRMNAFAKEGTVYLQARATSTWTLPSVVSMLTGQYASHHGAMNGQRLYEPGRFPPIQTRLASHGYRTVAVSHSSVVSPLYALDSGFQSFYLSDHLNSTRLRSDEANRLFAAWLQQQEGEAPIFGYVHTVDPHAPYSPPDAARLLDDGDALSLSAYDGTTFAAKGYERDPHRVSQLRALYMAEASHADASFGRFVDLLQWLGLYDDSLVVLAADHGEELAEHGGFDHGRTLYDELLRVPLVIKFPQRRWAATRVEQPVSLVDLAPTILSAAGALDGRDRDFDGRVLAPGPPARDAIFFAVAPDPGSTPDMHAVDLRGVLAGGVKCIENAGGTDRFGRPAPRLVAYQLSADPLEQHAVSGSQQETCRALLQAQVKSEAAQRHTLPTAPPEAVEKIRALGYVE